MQQKLHWVSQVLCEGQKQNLHMSTVGYPEPWTREGGQLDASATSGERRGHIVLKEGREYTKHVSLGHKTC
jgi:hypothetical protein